jgi:DNA polymerase
MHVRALQLAGVEFVPRARPEDAPAFPPPSTESAEPEPAAASDSRRVALQQLAVEVEACNRCPALYATRARTVFGGGPTDPALCFVADAPWDDSTAEPFRGDPAAVFDKMLAGMKFGREEVYLTTAIKCRPPRNRPPTAEECANCSGHLDRELDLVRPRFVCCLGVTAAQAVLRTTAGIQALRGKIHDHDGAKVVCTFHPAYLAKNESAKRDCWDDLKLLLTAMGRPVR